MKHLLIILSLFLFSLTVISCAKKSSTSSSTTDNDTTTTDSKMPIIIPTHNWSSQVVMAYVIGGIFESIGDRVAYTPSDSQAVYESIRLGDVTISHEVWQFAFGKSFDAARDKGGLLDWGDHEARTLEDMGFPNWVIDEGLCPGLPNWEALKSPSCARNFVTPDSGGKGRW